MGSEEKKITQRKLFYTKVICPICDGRGVVECCDAEGRDCVPVPCDRCDGKGYTVTKNIGTIIGGIVLVVAVIVRVAVLL